MFPRSILDIFINALESHISPEEGRRRVQLKGPWSLLRDPEFKPAYLAMLHEALPLIERFQDGISTDGDVAAATAIVVRMRKLDVPEPVLEPSES